MADSDVSGAGILKQKVAGIPVWVIGLAVGGGAAALLYFKSKSSSASAAAASQAQGMSGTSASNASSLYPVAPVTYVTGVQEPSASSSASTPTTPSNITINPISGSSVSVLSQPAASGTNWQKYEIGNVPSGQTLTASGAPVAGPSFSFAGTTSSMWQPVDWNGGTGYVWAPNVSGGLGGARGYAGVTDTTPWQSFAQRHHVPGYWSGLGGKGGSLSDAADVHGMPMERLQALNPFHQGGLVRVA